VLSVLDSARNPVATWRKGEIVLVGGETLPWELTSLLRARCRLGGDLWVAKPGGPRRRTFKAELSAAMLAREDVDLLAGIASILTHRALLELRSKSSIAGGPRAQDEALGWRWQGLPFAKR
jgi:hypothetical protein